MARTSFISAAVLVSSVIAGCGSGDKRSAQVAEPPPPALEPAPAPPPEPPAQPRAEVRETTVTGVFVDPTIASACGITPPKAFFEFDAAKVQQSDRDTLRAVAQCLSSGPLKGQALRVVGHADPRGPDEYNQKLGKSRAESVAEYLSNQGVERGKINTLSRGEEMATGTDEHGWAYDRRVDIRLAK